MNETSLIPATTIAAMVGAWRQAETEITQAQALLQSAQTSLQAQFNQYMSIDYNRFGHSPENVILELKRRAWRAIIDRTNIRKVMSHAKQKEMDDQVQKGDLPDITEENILAMLESNYNRVSSYAEEMIREVYQWLRPRFPKWSEPYKTNVECEKQGIGEKIILEWAVERGYGRNWQINYNKRERFTALDNVFHLLDGKGVVKSHEGPLCDAIATAQADGKFSTEYFEGRVYSNRNMHLKFRRLDLLAEFNRVAAGANLRETFERKAA